MSVGQRSLACTSLENSFAPLGLGPVVVAVGAATGVAGEGAALAAGAGVGADAEAGDVAGAVVV